MTKQESPNELSKSAIYSAIRLEQHSRKSILSVMQRLGESSEPVDIEATERIKAFFEGLKGALESCNHNIEVLQKLAKSVDGVFVSNNNLANEKVNVPDVYVSDSKYKENTLLISETSGRVLLPFNLSNLKDEIKNSKKKYSSVDEIIQKKYTIPYTVFKNPFMARFRESYKLMRNKEKASIKEAFDLGLELMFNYNLHPAIISACKNLDELDIYLDYLDNNETDKFDIFKIVFEIAPTVVKAKHGF